MCLQTQIIRVKKAVSKAQRLWQDAMQTKNIPSLTSLPKVIIYLD